MASTYQGWWPLYLEDMVYRRWWPSSIPVLPYKVKRQYVQISNIIDTSIKCATSSWSTPIVKGCIWTWFCPGVLKVWAEEELYKLNLNSIPIDLFSCFTFVTNQTTDSFKKAHILTSTHYKIYSLRLWSHKSIRYMVFIHYTLYDLLSVTDEIPSLHRYIPWMSSVAESKSYSV